MMGLSGVCSTLRLAASGGLQGLIELEDPVHLASADEGIQQYEVGSVDFDYSQ